MQLPESFRNDMKVLLGDEYDSYLDSYQDPRWYGLRVNTMKISVEEFLRISPFELKQIPWIENGFYYDGEIDKPGKHPYYFAGLYYLQEPSAMTPANRLPIEAGDMVLDLCAAPGGKTTELGGKLQGSGLLIANDISNSRARILLKNMEICGLGNICVMSENPEKMVKNFAGFFDKILVDAPCSGEGMFRKDEKMVKSWEKDGPEVYSAIQKKLVLEAAQMLKPGGQILFSTCTFNEEENEGTVEYLLEQFPEFELVEMQGYEGFRTGFRGLENCVRIWPHHMHGEGHFLALLHKRPMDKDTDISAPSTQKEKKTKIPTEVLEFFWNITWDFSEEQIKIIGEKIYYLPHPMPKLDKLRILRNGVLIGECKKNRFEPSQALAMYLKKDEYKKIITFAKEDIRVIKYLKGETIDVEDLLTNKNKGWYLVCVDGYPLGFAKAANQMLKNKYATGWRMQS
ncbi:MAG: RsmB/NOP family class I SAM-dependent RNA methyltransferase [Eubacteriales bacterium]